MTIVVDAMATYEDYEVMLPVPKSARLPIELEPPDGFVPRDLRTWPQVEGRLEYVDGRLLYMPPCGELQALLSARVVFLLARWGEGRASFDVGGNEAGLFVGRDVRGADALVWARVNHSAPRTYQIPEGTPLLAVEVAGSSDAEDESALLRKGRAYLKQGVKTVWLVLPETREVVVLRGDRTRRFERGDALPTPPELPALTVAVDELFAVL